MKLRCGRCRTTFVVEDAVSEMPCPACGAKNRVPGARPAASTPPAAAPPQAPIPGRASCDECGFRFAVGPVDVAICPNCRAQVELSGGSSPDTADPSAGSTE